MMGLNFKQPRPSEQVNKSYLNHKGKTTELDVIDIMVQRLEEERLCSL